MALEDEKKIIFIFYRGLDCYRMISFDLKNVGATYQCLMNKIFKVQINYNIEIYVDNLLFKSKFLGTHISDLEESFSILQRYKMKLNSSKCAFEITIKKFLGFMVSWWGIEANLKKIRVIQDMTPLKIIKKVQRLIDRIIILSYFVLRSMKHFCHSFRYCMP